MERIRPLPPKGGFRREDDMKIVGGIPHVKRHSLPWRSAPPE